jgi:TonB family protein
MKTSQIVLSAALFTGLLSVSALATPEVAHNLAVVAAMKVEAPAPARVVQPTGLPLSYEGKIVRLSLTIDAAGKPHDIRVVSADDRALTKSLVAAVSQWQFTPCRKNGVAVSTRVELPLELARS